MKPQVGWYTTICCDLDLRQIDNEIELAQVLEDADEFGRRFWATKEAALAELGTSNPRVEPGEQN
jgi:hypothetical protein